MRTDEREHQSGAVAGQSAPRKPARLWRAFRLAFFTVTGGVAALVIGFGIFASYIGALSTPENLEPADAIIVVTGGKSRLEAAVDLLKSGKGARLLISGVHPAAGRNDLRVATGGDRSLFNCCVDIDYQALDTIGNAQESAKWLKDHNYARAIIVTNNYHIPRTLLELRRVVTETEFVPYPVVNSNIGHGSWLADGEVMRVLLTEYAKYLAAMLRSLMPQKAEEAALKMVHAVPENG